MESYMLFSFFLLIVSAYGQDVEEPDLNSGSVSEDEYTYPCESLDDLDCIRNYFASTGQCTTVSHEDGDPITEDYHVGYIPSVNVTVVSFGNTITCHGSQIKTFRVVKSTNQLIMAVKFDKINIHTAHCNFVIAQVGKEPWTVDDFLNVTYSPILTAVMPSAGYGSLSSAVVNSYNTNAHPPFELGSRISNSSDEVVSRMYDALAADIPTGVQELFLTKAPFLFFSYFQHYICNYGYEYTGEVIQPVLSVYYTAVPY